MSLWRKRVQDGDLIGVMAEIQYPARPDAWVEGDPWPRDTGLVLVQAGLLNGSQSIFLRRTYTAPTRSQAKK